jgi:hypothetical protein
MDRCRGSADKEDRLPFPFPNCLPGRAYRAVAWDDDTTCKRLRFDDVWRPSGSLVDEDPVWGNHG